MIYRQEVCNGGSMTIALCGVRIANTRWMFDAVPLLLYFVVKCICPI